MKKKDKSPNPVEIMKMEIAEELGLAEKIRKHGWGSLTAYETGRVGGFLAKRLKDTPVE